MTCVLVKKMNLAGKRARRERRAAPQQLLRPGPHWMMAAMVLPPAPTKPDTVPSERLEMNGTTPYVAPHAACVRKEKMTIVAVALPRLDVWKPKARHTPPAAVCTNQSHHRRPRMPQRRAQRSDMRPPDARLHTFISPL